jgi:hypothetical protein
MERNARAHRRPKSQMKARVLSAVTGAGIPDMLRNLMGEIDHTRSAGSEKTAVSQWLP